MNPITLKREELFDLIWAKPFSAICTDFDLSRPELQKACAALNLPLPENGHWSKLKFGKAQAKPKLSADYVGPDSYTFADNPVNTKTGDLELELSEIRDVEAQIKKTLHRSLTVPDRLINPLPVILKAQKSLDQKNISGDRYDMRGTERDEVDIRVTKPYINRALRFMDTLLKCMFAQGFKIENRDKGYTYGSKERVSFRICFREKTKRLEDKGDRTLFEPTGELYFKIDGFGGRMWKDGAKLLEDQVLDIVVQM